MATRWPAQLCVVFLLALLAIEHSAEANVCVVKSKTFRGVCTRNKLCTEMCNGEGFTGGYCKRKGVSITPKCWCTFQCHGPTPPTPPPPGGDEPEPQREAHARRRV